MPVSELSCPHYPPTVLGGPQVICRGCGALNADNRHPQNQSTGLQAPTMLQRPELAQTPRKTERKG